MRVIWKYQLRAGEHLNMVLFRPKIRYVGQDPSGGDEPCVWIEHDPDEGHDTYVTITFIGTGHPVPEDHRYVGSCRCNEFVWHVYARSM